MRDQTSGAIGADGPTPYALHRGEGTAVWIVDALDTIKAGSGQTGGRFAVMEAVERQGAGPPLHVHEVEDEGYFVVEGEYSFFVGDALFEAREGTWVYAPRGIPHTFRCESPLGRLLWVIVPGGWESFFTEAGRAPGDRRPPQGSEVEVDVERLAEIAGRFGVRILGPSP